MGGLAQPMDRLAKPDIFHFTDFRKYLDLWQRWARQQDSLLSRSEISRRLGMPSTRSYFTDILRDRKVSDVMVERLLELMDLPEEESRHFRRLVRLGQALSAQEKELAFDDLIQAVRAPCRILAPASFSYYAEWTHSAVRAAIGLLPEQSDPAAIGRSIEPPIGPAQVKESLRILLELGLIRSNPQRGWTPTDTSIASPPWARDELVRAYQMQMIERVRNTVAAPPERPHNISTNMVTVSKEALHRIERRLQAFKEEVRAIVQSDEAPPEAAYQILLATIPVAHAPARPNSRVVEAVS